MGLEQKIEELMNKMLVLPPLVQPYLPNTVNNQCADQEGANIKVKCAEISMGSKFLDNCVYESTNV